MAGGGENSPIINGIVANDKVPWYRKKNLRSLYLWLVPFAMFIESTSGFDSSMMNVRLSLPLPVAKPHADKEIPGSPSTRLLARALRRAHRRHPRSPGFLLQSRRHNRHPFRPAVVGLGRSSLFGRLWLRRHDHWRDYAGLVHQP